MIVHHVFVVLVSRRVPLYGSCTFRSNKNDSNGILKEIKMILSGIKFGKDVNVLVPSDLHVFAMVFVGCKGKLKGS